MTRHFTRLSRWNYAIDIGMYPLGSCTMKYNPKVNERVARMPGFAGLHPAQSEESLQGALELMYRLERALCEISGFARVTLQPAAGAHGGSARTPARDRPGSRPTNRASSRLAMDDDSGLSPKSGSVSAQSADS